MQLTYDEGLKLLGLAVQLLSMVFSIKIYKRRDIVDKNGCIRWQVLMDVLEGWCRMDICHEQSKEVTNPRSSVGRALAF